MANIKLKDHYWETEGIYDAAQSKTQKAINADIAEVAQNNSDLIIMSSTQPSATGNKIWIKEGVSYQIPVMDDLISNNITNNSSVSGTNVTGALNTLGSNVSDLQGSLNSKVIQVTIPCSSAGTFNYTVSGLTANHRLLRCQFLSGGTTETGDVLADITTTTGANSLNVVISTVYTSGSVILLFGIPTVATATST